MNQTEELEVQNENIQTDSSTDPLSDQADPAALPTDDQTDHAPIADADPAGSELLALREEVDRLRQELSHREEQFRKVSQDCAEFEQLFPEVPLQKVPSGAWELVSGGMPLAAAYALYEKRCASAKEAAQAVNHRNHGLSAGAVGGGTAEEFYSPDEVRAMSRTEVKKHYTKILASMKHWH